jgi:hypothetical protein
MTHPSLLTTNLQSIQLVEDHEKSYKSWDFVKILCAQTPS